MFGSPNLSIEHHFFYLFIFCKKLYILIASPYPNPQASSYRILKGRELTSQHFWKESYIF